MELESFEESNPPDIEIFEVLPYLKQYWSTLSANDIKFHYHGTYNVFIIRNEYILRIPSSELRNQVGLEMIDKEWKKLHFFHNFWPVKSSYKFPNSLHLGKNQNVPYSIYKMIGGCSLCQIIGQMTSEDRNKIAFQIRDFLDIFHSPQLADKFKQKFSKQTKYQEFIQFSSQEYYQHWEKTFEMVQTSIFPFLNSRECDWLTILFGSFLAHPEYCQFSPTLSHGDFDTSNILINEKMKLSGIIDFEDCKIGDPAADLLFFTSSKEFQTIISKSTQVKYDDHIQHRIKFLFCRTCIPYLVWGLKYNKNSMITYGHSRLKSLMKFFPDANVAVI